MGWINIAKTGEFTSKSGTPVKLTIDRFNKIVENYNPKSQQAPLVFGHPQENAPAYGWVQKVRVAGDFLQAQIEQVSHPVKQLIKMGAYKYVSMSIFGDKLQHVGLLGATPPAIEGLGEIKLSSEIGETLHFDFSADENDHIEITGNNAKEEEYAMKLEDALERNNKLRNELSEMTRKVLDAEAKLSAAEKEKDEISSEFSAFKGDLAGKTREARIDAIIKAGKLNPANRASTLTLATALGTQSVSEEFSNAGVDSPEEIYFKMLEAMPKQEIYEEFAKGDGSGSDENEIPVDLTSKM